MRADMNKALGRINMSQLKDLKDDLEKRNIVIKEFRQQEIDLRRKQRELEDAKQAELKITRTLDEERAQNSRNNGENSRRASAERLRKR